MTSRSLLFNTILCALLGGLLGTVGCSTVPTYDSQETNPAKQLTVIRLHVQTLKDITGKSVDVQVFRARPVVITVDSSPFLTEASVVAAEVIEELGGFSIKVEFDREGRWLLEKYTAENQGRHLAIFASFGQDRWLAAPLVRAVISDGKLTFTPDANREEAVRIVRGLKNYARKMEHDPRF
jgi:hypothetical protein